MVCLLVGSGCLVRTTRNGAAPVALRTASLDQLLDQLKVYSGVKSVTMNVTIQLSVESDDRAEVKEYTDAPGFILLRRPHDIRVLAQVPVVRSTAFDMVSDGETFSVHLPSKNRYLVGTNQLEKPSSKRVENVRPQHLLEALFIDGPRDGELVLLDGAVDGGLAYHVVEIISREHDGHYRLVRKFWFERRELNLTRQQIFDENANMVTDARYGNWNAGGIESFAQRVTVSRPADGYQIGLIIQKASVNNEIGDDRFAMEPPAGVTVERIGDGAQVSGGAETPSDD